MGVKLLLFYVIYQTVITTTLGGVAIPFADSIGKVTPIKPKPLPTSTVSSSETKSSLICDNKDILHKSKDIPKLLPAAATGSVTREFSSPLVLTSSSRALPVPKIDSISIENVKIPESLKEKFLALYKGREKNVKLGSCSPEVSLPYKYPFLSSPTKLSNASPSNSLSDMNTVPLNKLSPLPSINSLPNVPVESLKRNGFLRSPFKANNYYKASPPIKLLSSGVSDSPKTLEARTPSFSDQFTSNISPLSQCLSPYPLHYKSMYLPRVKTPSEFLSYSSFPYKGAGNFNFPSQFSSHNLLSPKTTIFENRSNSLPGRNDYSSLPAFYPIKTAEILIPTNPIQLPKSPSIEPISTKIVSSAQNAACNNLWSPKETFTSSASVAFESKLEPSQSTLSSISLRGNQEPLTSLPYLWAGRTSDIKLKPCAPPVIKPPTFTSPKTPLVPILPSSPILDVLSNRISCFDCSKNIDIPNVFPIIGICTETIEKINPNNLRGNYETCLDSKHVSGSERIDLSRPSSCPNPSFIQECVPFKYSPPIIPSEPIPTISFSTSSFSPITYSPSRISQTPTTPISYINQSPTSSIRQSTSNMLSSITTLLSNVVQNILSSYKSNINTAPQNKPQTPTYTTSSDPYADVVLIPEETLSVVSALPFQQNPVNTVSILPVVSAPIDCLNAGVDSSTTVLYDTPCKSSSSEVTSSQPVLISSPQLTSSILPPTPLITFSSPPICPSYLPSPTLPSYPATSSPFYMEAPVFKTKSSKKDSEVEKMIELMLLAEILNNDENFDWDDLDTLLAFLSLS